MPRNEIISYIEMCQREGLSLQRGMNFNPPPMHSIVLSSHRPGAPYEDLLEDGGTTLIYEGHDEPKSSQYPQPKLVDQPLQSKNGRLTQNGLFNDAAQSFVRGEAKPVEVRVYEKIKDGIWSYNGRFALVDSWTETSGARRVFRFKLSALTEAESLDDSSHKGIPEEQRRIIPASVKLTVWKRDKGECVLCGSNKDLHFDHIVPFSKGGTSESADNIQLLCMKHNTSKGARIQ